MQYFVLIITIIILFYCIIAVKPAKIKNEYIRIDSKKGLITGQVLTYRYIDKDTKQFVIYSPSLELTGYGETEKKADEIFKFSLEEYFNDLIKLSFNLSLLRKFIT